MQLTFLFLNVHLSLLSPGMCDPIMVSNTCIVVNGETAVLLDHNSDATFVRNRVYVAISHGLSDLSFLNGFTNSVVSAALVSEGHASLVENSNQYHERTDGSDSSHHSGVTTTVAVAAASVTILVASVFCYGFVRRPNSHDPSVRHRNRSLRKISPRTVVSGSQLGVPMRRHFVRLEDLAASPTSFVTTSISPHSYPNTYNEEVVEGYFPEYSKQEYHHEVNYNAAINWSVSDITSDSASLRSGVSRTPSMLERIDEEIEDEEEDILTEGDDSDSCNFSYSEDSTIITKALSKVSVAGQDKCNDNNDFPYRSPIYKNVAEFDCANERQDRVLDISDLDPCFTIIPDNPEDVFRDLEDLSSEGTQESLLESIVLEMRLSTEVCENDSLEKTLSDKSINSLLSEEDLTKLNNLIKEDSYKASSDYIGGKNPEDMVLEANLATFDSNEVRLSFDLLLEKQDDSESLDSTIDETRTCLTDLSLQTKLRNNVIAAPSENNYSSATDSILTVTDSGKKIPASKVESEMDGSGTLYHLSPISTSRSHIEEEHQSLNDDKLSDSDAKIKEVHLDAEEINSISLSSNKGAETAGSNASGARMEDDLSTNLHAVDSIDEWVSELMNGKGKEKQQVTTPNA